MRKALMVLAALIVVTGCGTSPVVTGEPVDEPYAGHMHLPVEHDDPFVLKRSGAAGRALECGTEPYAGGSGDYDIGLASTQDSAGSALENYFAEEYFMQLPRDGYRVEREDDGRVLFSYDVGAGPRSRSSRPTACGTSTAIGAGASRPGRSVIRRSSRHL